MRKAVICHLFYPDNSLQLLERLSRLDDGHTSFFFNVQGTSAAHDALYTEAARMFPASRILRTSNKGRDIGAKLLLIALMLELEIDSALTLIIHDKKSPHLEYGSLWRDELFKITDEKHLGKVMKIFQEQRDVGIVGSGKYIQNEYMENSKTFASNSSAHLTQQMHKFKIQSADFNFIAGNIFWIRTDLLKEFFKNRSILEVRAGLETGNSLDFNNGTNIHSWERIMSWIATSQGYKIYGI